MSDTRSWRAAVSGWFLVLLCAPPIWAWQVRVARSRDVHPIVLDRAGAVVAALDVPPHPLHAGGTALALVKLDRSGGVRWRRRLRAHGRERRDFIYALQTTSDDDVLTAGSLYDNGLSTFFVARLAGRDGAVLWQGDVHGERRQPGDEAAALALGPDGDLVVAGGLEGASSPPNHFALDFAVVKLSADRGEERWRFLLDGSAEDFDDASAVAVDAAGDVVAVGTLTEGLPTQLLNPQVDTVIKVSGADGHLLWRRDIDNAVPYPRSVVLDRAGDVFIPLGTFDGAGARFAVMKLAGGTGEPIWTATVGGSADGVAFRVALVPPGDVAAVGDTSDADGTPALMAALLDAGTGSERWHRFLRGNDGYGYGDGLAVLPDGDVVVGGQFRNRHTCYDLSFARLSVASGEVRELRSLDGTTTVPLCDSDCEHGVCRTPPRSGLDRDRLSALTVDAEGRIVVAGVVCDGYHGRNRGLVAAISSKRDGMP